MTEAEFSNAHVVPALSAHFRLMPEAWMTHWSEANLRIDFAAHPREHTGIPRKNADGSYAVYGFEVKVENEKGQHFKQMADHFAQAIDYRMSLFSDLAVPKLVGIRPRFVFLASDRFWFDRADGTREELNAPSAPLFYAERIAGKFGVGIAFVSKWTGLTLRMCGTRIWCAQSGAMAGIEKYNTVEKIGSR